MATGTLWYAQQAEMHIAGEVIDNDSLTDTAVATTSTIKDLYDSLSSKKEWTGRITDLKISGGSRDMTAVNTFGISQLENNGRPDIVTAEFTLIYENTNSAEYISGSSIKSIIATQDIGGTTITTTYSRFQFGEKSTAAADRQKLAVLFILQNEVASASGNKTVNVLLNDASMTQRDYSLNSDGHVEEKWTIKCLAQNYFEESNF